MLTDSMDLRGRMLRSKRLMSGEEALEFLRCHKFAHVGTVDGQGWPYVVPLVYVFEGGDLLYVHSGDLQGHFFQNVQANARVCVTVSDMGELQSRREESFACDSALVYSSVVAFGTVRILHGPENREKKAWFMDRLVPKIAPVGSRFKPGYPMLDKIVLYEIRMEIVTGKHSPGLAH